MKPYEKVGTIAYNCAVCGKRGETAWKHKKFCSSECRSRNYYPQKMGSGLPTATSGALAELIVSSDLLKKGWEVFRALSPAAFCDLIAIKGGKILRIEVRTAYRPISGNTRFLFSRKKHGEIDHFGLFVNGSEVIYEPTLD